MRQRANRVSVIMCVGIAASLAACSDDPKRKLGANCASDSECVQGICGGGICIDPSADEDNDGLDNQLEVDLGTNPVNADTDNDGTRDREELDQSLGNLDIDRDGTPDVLESADLDEDDDCIPNQFDAQNTVADSELAGLVDVVCKKDGVCGAAGAGLAVVCDSGADKRVARCDYAAVPDFEPEEEECDGLDNDCDGAVDETSDDLDDDGTADCVDEDRDGDDEPDDDDPCPDVADDGTDTDGDGDGDACDVPQPPVVTGTDPLSPATDASPILFGSADANTPVDLYPGPACVGTPLATGTADADGRFGVEVRALDNDESHYVLRSKNAAGLVSACIPSSFSYVHDDTAPDAPTFGAIDPESPSTDDSPRVTGEAEAGARVELSASAECSGAPLGTGIADAAGDYSIVIGVAANTDTVVHASAIDEAGNRSSCAELTTYVHDGERPDPPAPHPSPFTPVSPSSTVSSPIVRGCADDGANVDVFTSAGCVGAVAANLVAESPDAECASGSAFFGLVAASPNATTTFHALVRGTTGEISACVSLGNYLHDSIAPAAPVFGSVSPTSPSSLASPTIVGSAEANALVTLFDDDTCDPATVVGEGEAASDGSFVIVAALPDNALSGVFAVVTDATGNTSDCTALTTYQHDGTVPVAPTPHPDGAFTPVSPSASDDTPMISGCGGEGASIDVYAGDDCLGAPIDSFEALIPDAACATGFAFGGPIGVTAPSSTTTFRADTANLVGMRSGCSVIGTYVYDADAPDAPALTAITPAAPSSSTMPVLEGTAEAGASVILFTGASCATGVEIGTTSADAAGAWTLAGQLEGLNTTTRFHAEASDDIGNTSPCAALGTWVHDDVAPRDPRMVASQTAAVTSPSNVVSPQVRFCTDSGTSVSAFIAPDCTGTSAAATVVAGSTVCAGVAGSEEQRFNLGVDRPETYYVRAVDGAGNRGDCVALLAYDFDDTPPAAPEVLRVKGTSWAMLDATNVDRVDLRIAGGSEPGARINFTIDGNANGTATADAQGRFEGTATAVSVSAAGLRRLVVRATDTAGNVGANSVGTDVVGDVTLTVTSNQSPQIGVLGAIHFPDGVVFVTTTTNASGVVTRRIFAGMMASVAFERLNGAETTRHIETFMDLMPGTSMPIDLTPDVPTVQSGTTTDLLVGLPPAMPGATEYLLQGPCGIEARTTTPMIAVELQFPDTCKAIGDRVDVLATALQLVPDSPFGEKRVLAYAFRAAVQLTTQDTFLGINPWVAAGSPGSTMTTSTFSVVNDTEATLAGILNSQHYRGAPGSEEDYIVSQLSANDEGFAAAMYLLPGTTFDATLPFISEVGPWRRLFAVLSNASFGEDGGLLALSYEVEQGTGTAPASFGSRSIKDDLLPLIGPNPLVPPGADLDRPVFGWTAFTSVERADIASAVFTGDHNCAGTCFNDGSACSVDGDCSGSSCNIAQCDHLEWRMAWRPWDAEKSIKLPAVPTSLTPAAFWAPGNQNKIKPQNIALMDLDFIDGWTEASALGRGVFPFGNDNFLGQIMPVDARVLISFLGDN